MGNDFLNDARLSRKIATLKRGIHRNCHEPVRSMHERHNFFLGYPGCCQKQCDDYLTHGYERMFLSLPSYLNKLTDYSEKDKILNYIEAYYDPLCHRNMILKVGFGRGALVRANHPSDEGGFIQQREGYSYLLSYPYLNGLHANVFPYDNVQWHLTYWWFKQNIICRDQEWICDQEYAGSHRGEASRSNTQQASSHNQTDGALQ